MSCEVVITMSGGFKSPWSEQDDNVHFIRKIARFFNSTFTKRITKMHIQMFLLFALYCCVYALKMPSI